MSWSPALVVAGFVWLAVLLLALNLKVVVDWRIKAAAIAVTTVFYFVSLLAWQGLGGWPTDAALPDEFQLLAYDVREPDKRSDSDGAIIIWARLAGADDAEPRAYRLPYERELHRKLRTAGEALRAGKAQRGEHDRQAGSGGPGDGGSSINFFPYLKARPPKPAPGVGPS